MLLKWLFVVAFFVVLFAPLFMKGSIYRPLVVGGIVSLFFFALSASASERRRHREELTASSALGYFLLVVFGFLFGLCSLVLSVLFFIAQGM